ncbi:NAD(P)-dependent oxidoreductase [Laspinema sp. A4]|uniref:NAD-dependent epimerase/dehydratase family protein n=1 Tax=Laspinema sp. D2d TaxID=2953686 RepID=UPI0021BA76B5|nr:NAD(P)-dependent oxidoreductase [Laspinema sp. D2d]MCT7983607.1 NAD(P)-dependent oxidoreductase [Laspinema sp. D2d]
MKVAITGATGFIGRYVLSLLLEQGYQVLVIGRSAPALDSRLTFVEVDLLKEKEHRWISEYQPSHLLHLAWYAEHGKYWTSPFNLSWCDATVKLIPAFVEQGGERVVVAGSCAEYDWSFGYCHEEKTPSHPTTLYGVAKDCVRRLAEKICDLKDVSLAWGRIFMPFGLGESPQRLIPSIIQAFLRLRPPFAIGIYQWRDILPVELVADGLIFLTNQEDSDVFNICSGRPIQLAEVIQKLGKILAQDPNFLLSMGHSSDDVNSFLGGSNAAIVAKGWAPEYCLETSLEKYSKVLSYTK